MTSQFKKELCQFFAGAVLATLLVLVDSYMWKHSANSNGTWWAAAILSLIIFFFLFISDDFEETTLELFGDGLKCATICSVFLVLCFWFSVGFSKIFLEWLVDRI